MSLSNALILLLFELGFGIKFNLIGVISVSELFLLLYVPLFVLPKVRWHEAASLKHITVAYVLLLTAQIVSEFMVGNSLQNSLKGLAITVVSYLHFMFLVFFLSRQKALIIVLIMAQVVRNLVFGTSVEEQSVEEMLQGQGATYLKFYVAPLLISAFLAVSAIYVRKSLPIMFALMGAVFILLGARSSGGMALTAGLLTFMLEHRALTFNKKALLLSSVVLCVVAYSFYAYYVSQVLSGNITSGNSWQLFLCKNPYNPLELLLVGRSEAWVGWQAFMDKFWFGHGAWAYDSTGRYQRMMLEMHDELQTMTRSQMSLHYLIPSHSVLIGSGMKNGIFAFLAMAIIIVYFTWKGMASFIKCDERNKLILIYTTLEMSTMALFSPQSHFRLTMSVAFAIIFILSKSTENKTEQRYTPVDSPKPLK